MVKIKGKEIAGFSINGKNIEALYKGDKLIWEGNGCCFSSKGWNGDLPWIGSNAWE